MVGRPSLPTHTVWFSFLSGLEWVHAVFYNFIFLFNYICFFKCHPSADEWHFKTTILLNSWERNVISLWWPKRKFVPNYKSKVIIEACQHGGSIIKRTRENRTWHTECVSCPYIVCGEDHESPHDYSVSPRHAMHNSINIMINEAKW